jgi:NAD(P)H-hydrate repair Nnr-like enzyme with NAD(P)H-hydrate epimerase domain
MRRIGGTQPETLYGAEATRAIERAATAALPPYSLMALAGLSVAQLTRALAPHARCIWIACGPGNNGGDGLVAATHLHRQAQATGGAWQVVVTLCAEESRLPPDAAHALVQARAAGDATGRRTTGRFRFCRRCAAGHWHPAPTRGRLAEHAMVLQQTRRPVLCVDLPSGLHADTGIHLRGAATQQLPGPRHTLALLTLKPGSSPLMVGTRPAMSGLTTSASRPGAPALAPAQRLVP